MDDLFDLIELPCRGAPAVLMVAVQHHSDGGITVLGAGRGLNRDTALASCTGEAIERAAAVPSPNSPVMECLEDQLPGPRISLAALWLFSVRQSRVGPHPTEGGTGAEWERAQPMMRSCRRWMRARTRNGTGAVFVPAAAALLDHDIPFSGSNGLAAAPTRSMAERNAVLELVERDAVAIWWFNACRRPGIPPAALDAAGGTALRDWLARRTRRTVLLDLTHDLRIPVAAAISADTRGSNIAYGFAAKMTLAEAALSAVLEMLQAELTLDFAAQREAATGAPAGPAGRFLIWSRQANLDRLPHLHPDATSSAVVSVAPEADPIEAVERTTGAPALFVDLDRPSDPLRVVRAIVPGLRHWKPRFAPGRLFDVPAKLGWAHEPLDETQIGSDVILI